MLLFLSHFFTSAQIINCNPDSNGPVWIAGGVPDSYTQHNPKGIFNKQIDLNNINPGMYYIDLLVNNTIMDTKKIIVL